MSARRLKVAWLALLLVSAAGAAEDEKVIFPGSAAVAPKAAESVGGSLNSMSLFVAVALAGVGGWMVWRNRRNTTAGREARALAIDETRSLGNRQFLVVASYEGKKFLLGVCPGRIELLSPLDGTGAVRGKGNE